jgi:hypothetical protein
VKPSTINRKNNFIDGWYLNDLSICDGLINLFEKSSYQRPGRLSPGRNEIDKTKKDSTDISVSPKYSNKIIQNYLKNLSNIVDCYKKKYIYCDKTNGDWAIRENINIQRYLPKQGYHLLHHERCTVHSSLRHLVFMTYLNDVKKGGETEFYYQKLKVKPKKGLTLIWGTDWTFTHKGIVAPEETKYIITGWYSYFPT